MWEVAEHVDEQREGLGGLRLRRLVVHAGIIGRRGVDIPGSGIVAARLANSAVGPQERRLAHAD